MRLEQFLNLHSLISTSRVAFTSTQATKTCRWGPRRGKSHFRPIVSVNSNWETAIAAAILAAATACLAQTPPAPQAQPPDLIFYNAVIYTGEGLAQDHPQTVQAMAINDDKIVAIGSNAQIKALAGPKTALRDLSSAATGVSIFPGFNDAHTHFGMAGLTQLNLDLTGAPSLAAMLTAIHRYASNAPQGHWITGGNWDHTLWARKALPTARDLDTVTLGHPAFLQRIDGHIAVCNSAALAAAGITGKTVPPPGGAIDVDAFGQATGILRESAKDLVQKVIPPPTPDERLRGAQLAVSDALAHGVTSVQDFSDWPFFLAFEQMERMNKLNLRITEWLPFNASLQALKAMRAGHDPNDPMLHTGMLKGFMDGSLGSRTAALKEPYADAPANTGLPQYTQGQLNQMAIERAQAGFQLGFHAIGDKAASMALDAFSQPGISTTARNRIEHAQVVDPADIPRFKALGVIASMQPSHLLTDMNWAQSRLGPQRAAYSYAWKAFLDAGVPLAFGTDYPVEPITPFRGLYAAVTRSNETGTQTYFPQNKLTRGQALYAYTQGSAYAEFAEKHKGKLIPGYDADFILLDRDLYTIPAPSILGTKVLETWVSGQQSYAANLHLQ